MINLEEYFADLYCDDLKLIRECLDDGYMDIDQMANDYAEPDVYYRDQWKWLDKVTDEDNEGLDNALIEALEENPHPDGFFNLLANMQAIYRHHYFYEDRDDKLEYIAVYYLVKVLGIRWIEEDELKSYIEAVQRDDGCGEDLDDWKECFRAHITTAGYADLDDEEEDDE